MHKRAWTEGEVAFLRANYRRMTPKEIGLALGRGPRAAIPMITKLRLWADKHQWLPEHDEFLRANAGKGWPWCAKEMGRTVISIYNRVRRIGLQLKMLKQGDLDLLRKLCQQGKSNVEIGEVLGVTDECVRRWRNLWKLPMHKRDEKKRMKTQTANFIRSYGVTNVAQARKVRKRRARAAVMVAGIQSLGNSLAEALKEAEGKPCRISSG